MERRGRGPRIRARVDRPDRAHRRCAVEALGQGDRGTPRDASSRAAGAVGRQRGGRDGPRAFDGRDGLWGGAGACVRLAPNHEGFAHERASLIRSSIESGSGWAIPFAITSSTRLFSRGEELGLPCRSAYEVGPSSTRSGSWTRSTKRPRSFPHQPRSRNSKRSTERRVDSALAWPRLAESSIGGTQTRMARRNASLEAIELS